MTQREKLLALVVLTIFVAVLANTAVKRYFEEVDRREKALMAARDQLGETKLAAARGRRAMEQVEAWQKRSLPDDRQLAQAQYKTWLVEKLKHAGLENSIHSLPNAARGAAYESVGYRIKAEGELDAIITFLEDFYRCDQLHKITFLQLQPKADSTKIDVSINVEALMVQGADKTQSVSEGVSDRLQLADVEAYRNSVVSRNIFKPFTPEEQTASSEGESTPTDEAANAFVTFISGGQVWITVRVGEPHRVLRLRQGDKIEIAGFQGKIEEVRRQAVVVASGEQRLLFAWGKNLSEGRQLTDDRDDET